MKKRVTIATICGLLSGLFCIIADIEAGLASNVAAQLPYPVIGEILCNRTLVGFAIGISGLALYHWSLHGIAMGFLFSLPLAFSCLMTPQYPGKLFVLTLVFGMLYGLFAEFVTSVVFKAPQSWMFMRS
jgi:hypothetical protein